MLRKEVNEPWLGYIASGQKPYEGRLNKGQWAQLQPGSELIFYNKKRALQVTIENIRYYKTFGQAWSELGANLLPGINCLEDANKLYNNFYNNQDIERYGVVVFKLGVT